MADALQTEFEAWLKTRQASREFGTQQAFQAHQRDLAQGGSIRQAPVEPNLPFGAVTGGTIGGLAGGPPGAVVGAMGGEAVQQLVEHAIGSPAAPATSGQAAQRIATEGAFMVGAEAVGRLGRFLIEKTGLLRPFAGTITPEAKEATGFVRDRLGSDTQAFLPAEQTSSRILDIMQNVSEFSLLGGGAIKTFKENRNQFFEKLADDIVNRHGQKFSDVDIGLAVVDSVKHGFETAQAPARLIYDAIERITAPAYAEEKHRILVKATMGKSSSESAEAMTAQEVRGMELGVKVQEVQQGERLERLRVMVTAGERQISGARIDLRPLKEDIAIMSDVATKAGGLSDREMGTTLLRFINGKPDLVSYPVAKAIRTEVRTLRDTLASSLEAKNAPAIGKADSIYDKLTTQIRKGLEEDNPVLAEMWDEANVMTAGAHDLFRNRLVSNIVKLGDDLGGGRPEAIVDAVWRKNNTSVITAVRHAVTPEAWQKLQRVELERVMSASLDEAGILQGTKLHQRLFGRAGLGEEALVAGFDKATAQEMKGLVNALNVAQQKQSEGTGRVLIQLRQGGVALALAGAAFATDEFDSELLGAAGVILLGPAALGRLMTSPGGIKFLTEGLTSMPKAETTLRVLRNAGLLAVPREITPPDNPTQAQPFRLVQ